MFCPRKGCFAWFLVNCWDDRVIDWVGWTKNMSNKNHEDMDGLFVEEFNDVGGLLET